MAKLRPCPFCGGIATRSARAITAYYYEVEAHCNYCGCEIRHKVSMGCWVKNPEREAMRWVSRLWNKREKE